MTSTIPIFPQPPRGDLRPEPSREARTPLRPATAIDALLADSSTFAEGFAAALERAAPAIFADARLSAAGRAEALRSAVAPFAAPLRRLKERHEGEVRAAQAEFASSEATAVRRALEAFGEGGSSLSVDVDGVARELRGLLLSLDAGAAQAALEAAAAQVASPDRFESVSARAVIAAALSVPAPLAVPLGLTADKRRRLLARLVGDAPRHQLDATLRHLGAAKAIFEELEDALSATPTDTAGAEALRGRLGLIAAHARHARQQSY